MVEVLSQYILFINDKLFNSIPFLPFDISLKWQELRQILTVKPLDMDKIRDYTSDLYEMKSSANSIPEERSRKSSKMILKKNSIFAIKHNLSNFGKEPEKDEVNFEGGFEDLVRKNSNNLMLKWRKSVKKQEGGGGMSPVANRYFAKELVEEKPMLKLMSSDLSNLKECVLQFQTIFEKNTSGMEKVFEKTNEVESPKSPPVILKRYSIYNMEKNPPIATINGLDYYFN